ncbi:cytochrome P450 [Streptomyces sp. Ag109_G2-15]|uniref:cytochrome P450 n=1 Tax=Streptomyces sp. Ag109_G2-15 TaxID=1938850 RepID=UPI000BD2211E|nr:cytochrome P450 [Streptomyces sp. Ag109_G2-15]SOD81252.1 pentalenene oxygenase [Streptomyces sp. Ag109_G2-15]
MTAEPSTPDTEPPDRAATLAAAPGALPLLGHAWQLRFRPLRFLDSLCGQADLVALRLGPVPGYLVNHPRLVHELLVVRHQEFTKTGSPLWETVRVLVGNGLGTSEGETHLRQRRALQPLFHPHRMEHYARIMTAVAEERGAAWQNGQLLRVDREMYRIAAAALTRCLYSVRLPDDAVHEITTHLPVAFAGVGKRAALPVGWLHALPTRENRAYTTAVRRLHALVTQLVDGRRQDPTPSPDLLTALLAARDEHTGQPLAEQQIHDEVMTLLLAGTDTTAALLAWTLHLLGAHPDVDRRLNTELRRELGDKPPTLEDLPRLGLLRRVVAETLRLYPPAWLTPRRAATGARLGGHRIPEGAYVFYSPYALHHAPGHHPRPDRFDPDRPEGELSYTGTGHAFLPYGAGPHKCIGNAFSLAQVHLALATILPRWRLRPEPSYTVRPRAFTTLSPGPLPMRAEQRAL